MKATFRTASRLVLLLAALAAAGAGCSREESARAPAPPAAGEASPRAGAATQAEEQRRMVWGPGWRVSVKPVFSGAAISDGTGTLTVEEWAGGPGRVTYEFPAATLASLPPGIASQSAGLIRHKAVSGSVVVPVHLRSRAVFTPPGLWPGGDAHAPGPLVWFPYDVVTSLRERGAAEVAIEPLPKGLQMRTEAGVPGTVKLTVDDAGEAVLRVNGTPTRFPVVRLRDQGGSTYTLLNSAENPLVIRFRLGKETSVGGRKLVTGAQSGYDVVALDGPE